MRIKNLFGIIIYMKILYFTGTGNCLSVAKRFNAELLSIPQMLKNNIYEIEDDVVGIVYPTYAVSIPEIVRKYLSKCKINATYVFVIATYGFTACGSLHVIKKVLESNGNKADYYESLLMVDNYLPFFDIDEQLAHLQEKNIEKNLNKIVEEFNSKIKKEENCGFINNIISNIGNLVVKQIEKYTPKMFYITDKCVSCGVCKSVCPMANIIQNDKQKPVYGDYCESCLACIHNCPQNAIHLKFQKSSKRFRNEDVTLKEIIEANNINI